ncbi:MAG: AMP-binding protein [Betaproteobacteria bacterium]
MEELLAPHERTVPAMLRRAAERFGERPLLAIPGATWRHRDAVEAVARRAGALRAAGIGRGERVALMCSNRIEQLETFLACGWIGAVAVPINTAAMGPQIDYYLTNSGAKLLVLEEAFVRRLRTAVNTWVAGAIPQGEAVEAEAVAPAETLAILYTSGTTGPSKGVVCPHAQYFWWGLNTARVLGVRGDDALCTTLPLFHINALNTFAQALLLGCRVAFEPRFSVSEFWSTMRDRGATVTYLLGAMVPMLLSKQNPLERMHRLRVALAPGVPPAAMDEFRARTGVALVDGYGSTETNFVIAAPPDSPRKGVMGWLRPGFEARVAQDGELLLRADDPLCFAGGYFGMPDKTEEAWRGGWFHTGDRVVRDADGAFRFVDRIKEAIRRRGENISSWEVEQVLLMHPAVAGAAVYPVASELGEDEVMAALVLKAKADPAAICAWCETRLPRFAIPRFIDVVDELPRTENGKVQKYKLRERGVTATTWDRQK